MVLSEKEEVLIGVLRTLPPAESGRVLNWAYHLAAISGGAHTQWSDSWSDEDLADVTASAVADFEQRPEAL